MENMKDKNDNTEKDNIASEREKTNESAVYGKIRKTSIIGIIVLTVFLASIFGASFGLVSGVVANIFSAKIGQYFPVLNSQKLKSDINKQQIIVEDSAVIDVVEKVSSSVVSIVISKNIPARSNNIFDPFGLNNGALQPSQNTQKQTIGGGSGFFITADGYIMTNRHVVEDQQADYTVVASDGKEYVAKVLARDPVRDVAIIKIEGNNFPIATLGNSDGLKIGQTVIAIGNSLGEFSNSVSRGIVSGLKRNLNAGSSLGDTERLTDIIQTDAAINPGNSGGPLLDINGNVIGINVAVAQGAQNVGFALPIDQAKRLIEQVKTGIKIPIPYLGVRYITIDSVVQKDAQLQFDYGVLVLRGSKMTDLAVIPGSPADKAGIVENDIILEINGQKITQDNQLADMVSKYAVNDVITLKISHKGETKDIQVKLQERQ
jgi:S1-C subfamily serine protease